LLFNHKKVNNAGEEPSGHNNPESVPVHHEQQMGGRRKIENRFRQIPVGVAVSRQEPADEGENPREIDQVQGAQERVFRKREFQDHRPPSLNEHPAQFVEKPVGAFHVSDTEGDHGAMNRSAFQRYREGIADQEKGPPGMTP